MTYKKYIYKDGHKTLIKQLDFCFVLHFSATIDQTLFYNIYGTNESISFIFYVKGAGWPTSMQNFLEIQKVELGSTLCK